MKRRRRGGSYTYFIRARRILHVLGIGMHKFLPLFLVSIFMDIRYLPNALGDVSKWFMPFITINDTI
jgi:hypothetical protein